MERENAVIKQRCHSKPPQYLVSGAPQGFCAGSSHSDLESSTHAVSQRQQPAWKMLNQVQHDNTNLTSGLHPTYNGNGFTPSLVIPVLAARANAEYSEGQKSGFTLIELLVVVLIIGILAAVALPQYQKTVWKSRNAQLKQLVKSVAQAEQAYYMANGHYAANFDELSIDLPLTPVATTVGGTTGTCQTTTQGTDSARAGKDFYVALNPGNADISTLAVVAYWDAGKYTCAGFSIGLSTTGSPQTLHCRERFTGNYYTAGEGEFCAKIEKGTRDTSFSNPAWRIYQLP